MELFTKQDLLETIEQEVGLRIGDLCKFHKHTFASSHNDRYTVLNNRIAIFINVCVDIFYDNQSTLSWYNNDISLIFLYKNLKIIIPLFLFLSVVKEKVTINGN